MLTIQQKCTDSPRSDIYRVHKILPFGMTCLNGTYTEAHYINSGVVQKQVEANASVSSHLNLMETFTIPWVSAGVVIFFVLIEFSMATFVKFCRGKAMRGEARVKGLQMHLFQFFSSK